VRGADQLCAAGRTAGPDRGPCATSKAKLGSTPTSDTTRKAEKGRGRKSPRHTHRAVATTAASGANIALYAGDPWLCPRLSKSPDVIPPQAGACIYVAGADPGVWGLRSPRLPPRPRVVPVVLDEKVSLLPWGEGGRGTRPNASSGPWRASRIKPSALPLDLICESR